MKRILVLAPVAVLLIVAALWSDDEPKGKYRPPAKAKTLARWQRDFREKRPLVPALPEPRASEAPALDFSGTYRFGPYDYDLIIEQHGDQVTFRSGGVDHQDIGGAFDTIGMGVVRGGTIQARWWCFDLSRNYGNNGGAEMWFHDGDLDELRVRYYHDADERIEEGYGVRLGKHEGKRLEYRIRIPHPVKEFDPPLVLQGTVTGRAGEPLADAVVMLRHDEKSAVRTDAHGVWTLPVAKMPSVLMLSAAAPGYVNAVEAILLHEVRDVHLVLQPSPWSDDPDYEFVDPTRNKKREIWNCGNCHRNSYDEWTHSRHALTARNAVTRAVYERDFLPALARGDAKGDEGLCAACHAPQAALDGNVARLDRLAGVARLGNHCDFCHKVHHTDDPESAGVRGSLALGRPSPDDDTVPGPIKRIYGPLADSDYLFMGPVHNAYFKTGALCAGCHQYTTSGGLPALATYAEWRAWAGARRRHESCQTCHMPTGVSMEGKKLARRICINALRRPSDQIHDHSFLGRDLIETAVDLSVQTRVEAGQLVVETTVRAHDVGHKVPTGSADKHLLLVVRAGGVPLVGGPRVPAHAGTSDKPPAARRKAHDFAGMPGREFAQVFADAAGRTHVPFWRAARLVEDTRLVPDEPVVVRHVFDLGGRPAPEIEVTLWHRLRFKAHDVAAGVDGPGVRPLDVLVAREIAHPGR